MRISTIAASAAVFGVVLGGATVAVGEPGPNDRNMFGLCTAYFSGSEKGQEQKRKAPPFQGLEAAAEAADQTVEEYCAENGTHPGQGKSEG